MMRNSVTEHDITGLSTLEQALPVQITPNSTVITLFHVFLNFERDKL